VHLPENVGNKDLEVILLDLKNRKTFDNVQTGRPIVIAAKPNRPDAMTADPKHYSVQFENDAVRLLRIRLGPGEKTIMHAHPANCGINLTGGTTLVDTGERSESKPGTVECLDAQAHWVQNIGTKPFEAIAIEFKNQDKFKS
jgi:hypothetical protein